MKKIIVKMVVVFATFISSNLFATTSGQYQIRVTVVEELVGIRVVEGELNLNYVVRNTSVTTRHAGSTAVRNIGTVNINLQARISGNTFGWSAGTALTDNGVDRYVLAMIFHEWNGLVVSTNPYSCFDDNDVLTTVNRTATDAAGNVFAAQFIAGQSVATPGFADGVGIAPYSQVNNHFFFRAPVSLSDSDQYGQQQTITVTLTAVQQ